MQVGWYYYLDWSFSFGLYTVRCFSTLLARSLVFSLVLFLALTRFLTQSSYLFCVVFVQRSWSGPYSSRPGRDMGRLALLTGSLALCFFLACGSLALSISLLLSATYSCPGRTVSTEQKAKISIPAFVYQFRDVRRHGRSSSTF